MKGSSQRAPHLFVGWVVEMRTTATLCSCSAAAESMQLVPRSRSASCAQISRPCCCQCCLTGTTSVGCGDACEGWLTQGEPATTQSEGSNLGVIPLTQPQPFQSVDKGFMVQAADSAVFRTQTEVQLQAVRPDYHPHADFGLHSDEPQPCCTPMSSTIILQTSAQSVHETASNMPKTTHGEVALWCVHRCVCSWGMWCRSGCTGHGAWICAPTTCSTAPTAATPLTSWATTRGTMLPMLVRHLKAVR